MSQTFTTFNLKEFELSTGEKRRQLGAQVDDICRATGFLAITGHGVSGEVIDGLWAQASAFFDQSYELKSRLKAPYPGYPYGYLGPGSEALAKSRGVESFADLKESFNGGPLSIPEGMVDEDALKFCYAKTLWPDNLPAFQPAWRAYYGAMEDLAFRIMRLFAVALKLPEDAFDETIDKPISALRALNYPAQTVAPEPGQLRAGAHSDYGSLTILLPQSGSQGLEILTREGDWLGVPPIEDAFVINIGDLMARWTNDRWVSTLHRVVNPPDSEAAKKRRQSFAYFHQPNWHQQITCLPSCLEPGETCKYEPVDSGPYLMSKFQATVKTPK